MYFAQVREDPNVELFALEAINKKDLDILCICSGGCTILSLFNNNNIKTIDAIDVNKEQLYLCELKKAICCYYNNITDILKFYQGEYSEKEYLKILISLNLKEETKNYWLGNMKSICFGVNRDGKFEELFRNLVKDNFNFDKNFDKNNLIKIFGDEAVVNSKECFINHFKNIIETHKNKYSEKDNYFYHQILYDKYDENCLPPYFYCIDSLKKNYYKINYICNNFLNHINSCVPNSYDLVQTSNISDWMNNEILEQMIKQIHLILKTDGIIIMRRLIGNYKLKDILSKYFNLIDGPQDNSHFYSEVVIGKKL